MKIKQKIRNAMVEFYQWFYSNIVGIKKNKVIFLSFNGKSYSDNPRSISEAVHEVCPEAEIVWLFLKPQEKAEIVPSYVRIANASSRSEYFKEICTCKVLVTNFLLPKIKKSKKQFFIQTWHGDRAFKKVLLDATYPHVWEQEEGYCNLAIAGSDYGERQYRSAFAYTGKVLKIGTPRDDRYLSPNENEMKTIREKIGVSNDIGLVLYAPTLRDSARDARQLQNKQSIDIAQTLDALEKKYGRPWKCLVRAHPGVIGLAGFEYSDKLINVSDYEDMSDLLLVSDMLITDYSSCAGDFALLGRPLVLYQSDIKEYCKNTRQLYFDVRESPYFIAENQTELTELIGSFTDQRVKENCKAILDFYGTHEYGASAVEVAKIIKEQISS